MKKNSSLNLRLSQIDSRYEELVYLFSQDKVGDASDTEEAVAKHLVRRYSSLKEAIDAPLPDIAPPGVPMVMINGENVIAPRVKKTSLGNSVQHMAFQRIYQEEKREDAVVLIYAIDKAIQAAAGQSKTHKKSKTQDMVQDIRKALRLEVGRFTHHDRTVKRYLKKTYTAICFLLDAEQFDEIVAQLRKRSNRR